MFGEWTGSAETPKCVGDTCELPAIGGSGGKYLGNGGNFRAGQHILHNAFIEFQCPEEGTEKNEEYPLKCNKGRLWPQPPKCLTKSPAAPPAASGDRATGGEISAINDAGWISYTAGSHLFENGDIERVASRNFDDDLDPGTTIRRLTMTHEGCTKPEKIAGSLIYLDNSAEPLPPFAHADEMRYPHGAVVRFDCLPDEDEDGDDGGRRMRSWKIVCKSGEWVGEAQKCDEDGKPVRHY